MTDKEIMQMALDALELVTDLTNHDDEVYAAIEALRARLTQPEPDDGYCQACDGNHCTAKNGCVALDNPRAQPEPEPVTTLFGSLPVYDVPPKQEPVAWMHNFIDEVVIAHRPADLDRHPDRWTALYKDPTPCQTCEALACTVMMDQVSYDTPPRHREPPTQDLSAPLTVNGVPMYPQREWQGLTDEERTLLAWESNNGPECVAMTEAKLKEKNT